MSSHAPVKSSRANAWDMFRTSRTAVSIFCVVVLFFAIALFVIGLRHPPPANFHGFVKDLLPTAEMTAGWQVEYLPIADTPEMKAKVDEALNYDDAVFAVYTRGTQRIAIYIAYWKPGKMPHRLIATHTPDVCWVSGGWVAVEAESGVSLAWEKGERWQPCEYRRMRLDGRDEYVLFWHVANGESLSYGTKGIAPWYAFITDLFSRNLDQRPEQFFVRVSSSNPIRDTTFLEALSPILSRNSISP